MRTLTAPSAEIGPAGPRVRPLSWPVVLLGLCSWSALLVVLLGKDLSWDLLNDLAIVTLPAIVVGLIYGLVQGLNGVAVWLIARAVLPVAEGSRRDWAALGLAWLGGLGTINVSQLGGVTVRPTHWGRAGPAAISA